MFDAQSWFWQGIMSKMKGNWYMNLSNWNPFGTCYRRVGQSHSFKEDKRIYGPASSGHFRRTVSETQYAQSPHEGSTGQHPAGRAAADTGSGSPNWARNK